MNLNLDKTTIFVLIAAFLLYAFLAKTEKDINDAMMQAHSNSMEKFNVDEYSPAMRSFGRTSHLNEAVYNAQCNPNGEYYVMRYNQPTSFIGRPKDYTYPYTISYYNPCAHTI